MKHTKRIVSILLILALAVSVITAGTISSSAAGTGVGLAEWAMRAYNEGWSYVWGGDSVGAVDCSGMITSYCGGNRTSMLADAQAHGRDWGYVSDGIPNIHGLGLSRPNHVGVYVGNGMEVDARGDDYGVVYQAVGSRWNCWFKLTAITYPTTGWQKFNGNSYYYENGEYITDTTRTIDGKTYTFSSSGIASGGSVTESASSASAPAKTQAEDNGPLKKGSQGARVEKLQARLQELGYYDGAIDGDFGEMTEQAFKRFQKQAGLYEDGIAGSDAELLYADDAPLYAPVQTPSLLTKKDADETHTVAELAETAAADPADPDSDDDSAAENADESARTADTPAAAVQYANGDSGEDVVTVQDRLIKLGYLSGEADGSFGAMTETAVRDFQTANRLEVTGVVDQNTYSALFSPSAVKNSTPESEAPTLPAAVIAATTANDAVVERDNAAQSQSAIASVTESVNSRRASTANLEFIVWLAIIIAVMTVAFGIVCITEKKRRKSAVYAGRRFQ